MPFTTKLFLLLTALMLCWSIGLVYCGDFYDAGLIENPGNADVQFFFSPYNSMGAYLEVIQNAKETLDIYTPIIGSNNGCNTKGCSVISPEGKSRKYQETFPIFRALVSAAFERGVRIRILTDGSRAKYFRYDKVTPAQFLYIADARLNDKHTVDGPGNKIDIRLLRTAYHEKHDPHFFDTLTIFQHAKVIIADYGKEKEATLISSVNWSHGGFFVNADQGVIVRENKKVAKLVRESFDFDWGQAKQDYKCECGFPFFEKEAIHSIRKHSQVISLHKDDNDELWKQSAWGMSYDNDLHFKTSIKVVFAHPDGCLLTKDQHSHAYINLMKDLTSAKRKVEVMMYDMIEDNICKLLLQAALQKKEVEYILRVSHRVVAKTVSKNPCYKMLTESGPSNLKVFFQDGKGKGPGKANIQYEHEKFWIVDDEYVMMSTGNWKSKELPDKQMNHICYRGFTIGFQDKNVVNVFQNVIREIGGNERWQYSGMEIEVESKYD